MNYEELKATIAGFRNGELNIDALKKAFLQAKENRESIKAEISKTYTLAKLKRKVWTSYGKKADYVEGYFGTLLGAFNITGRGVTYSFSESYEDALAKLVKGQTQEDLDKYIADLKKRRAATKKALEDPQTLEEFRTFLMYKGQKSLTKDQKRRYEQLLADRELDNIQRDETRKATVKAVELGQVSFELQKTKHTKKGHDLWVVKLTERVEKDKYKELNRKAKKLGGYYSSYAKGGAIPGFQFTSAAAAQQFMALKEGDVKQETKISKKYAKKQNKVAAKLLTMAETAEEGARESFSRDRRENTARRARMAKSARQDAEQAIYNAKVLRAIAEALEAGKIKYLARIDSAVQLSELRTILFRANHKRMIDQNIPYRDWQVDFEKDIEYVIYPYPSLHWEAVYRISLKLQGIKGQMLRGRRLEKAARQAKYSKKDKLVYFRGSLLEDLRKASSSLGNYEQERIKSAVSRYDRIRRMKLTTLPLLKTALREYHQYAQVEALSPEEKRAKEIKELENEFRRQKIDGFFPTPRPLVIRMLELAGIEEKDTILEPSAGLGHIADVISEKYPENKLTLIERFHPLVDALKKKGYEATQGDFLQHKGHYDAIIMNPPFERLQDIDHVRHAYSLLKPGGRLVAIMAANKGEGATRKKIKQFREWLEKKGAYVEENPEGAFKSGFRPTGVRTITVAIDKAPGQEAPPEVEPEKVKKDPEPVKEAVTTLAMGEIHLDEKRFQNRSELNQAIVNEIAENFDPNQFDPVVIWKDPGNGKIYLLAGHHRYAGIKKAGRKEIKVRWFTGSEAQAITYAKELSNANRTLETPVERAAIYRTKLKKGEDPKKVRAQAEKLEGKNWRYVLNLAHLNPDGKTVNALLALIDNSDKATQQNLEKIADWTGEARRQFQALTNAHENEMYDFLLENFKARKPAISRKDLWIERVRAIVQALDFKKTNPLNLKRIQYKTQGESEYEVQMWEIDEQIKKIEKKKEELRSRFNNPTHKNYVSPDLPDYDQLQKRANGQIEKLDQELKAIRKKKLGLAQKKGKMVKGGLAQTNLFASVVEQVEKEVDDIRIKRKQPERNKQTGNELADTYEKAWSEKDYIKVVRSKLERARQDKVKISEAEVIRLGIMIRPLIQSFRGALIDITSTNKRVLAPTLNNLLRWSQNPGRYDLVGVDIAGGAKPTVVARKVKRARIFNLLGLK